MAIKPPPPKLDSGASRVEAFIGAAAGKESLPWKAPHVRDDVEKQLNLRAPEPLLLKLDWVAKHTHGVGKAMLA